MAAPPSLVTSLAPLSIDEMAITEVIDRIESLNNGIAKFWSKSDGWAPVAAAGLLGKSRLDWQTSLSGALRRARGKDPHYTLPGPRPHTAEDHEPVIVKSGGGSSFSPLATIRRNSSGNGRCNFRASGVSPSSQRSTSSGVVRITGIALG